MFDVFRFAWFAVRTFIGVILLVVTLYAALWLFVKILSAAPGNGDPGAGLRRMNSYNAQTAAKDRAVPATPQDRSTRCSESREGCGRQ